MVMTKQAIPPKRGKSEEVPDFPNNLSKQTSKSLDLAQIAGRIAVVRSRSFNIGGTNWNRHTRERKTTSRQYMFGEGLGNNLGLDAPKYTKTYTPQELEAVAEKKKEDQIERKKEGINRARRTRERNKKREEVVAAMIAANKLLEGCRIFHVYFPKGDWKKKEVILGGLPRGVTKFQTDFGMLLIVPVIEENEGRKRGLKIHSRDRLGRPFWVESNTKEKLTLIFGQIDFKSPLTKKQASNFGMEL